LKIWIVALSLLLSLTACSSSEENSSKEESSETNNSTTLEENSSIEDNSTIEEVVTETDNREGEFNRTLNRPYVGYWLDLDQKSPLYITTDFGGTIKPVDSDGDYSLIKVDDSKYYFRVEQEELDLNLNFFDLNLDEQREENITEVVVEGGKEVNKTKTIYIGSRFKIFNTLDPYIYFEKNLTRAYTNIVNSDTLFDSKFPSGEYNVTIYSPYDIPIFSEVRVLNSDEPVRFYLSETQSTVDSNPITVTLELNSSIIYGNREAHSGKLSIVNNSNEPITGVTAKVSGWSSNFFEYNSTTGGGRIDSGSSLPLDLQFSVNPIQNNIESVQIDLEVTSAQYGKKSFSKEIEVRKDNFNIRHSIQSSGVRTFLQREDLSFFELTEQNTTLPLFQSGEDLRLIFINSSSSETPYSFTIDGELQDTSELENATADEKLKSLFVEFGDGAVAYLHGGDVDSWEFTVEDDGIADSVAVLETERDSYFERETIEFNASKSFANKSNILYYELNSSIDGELGSFNEPIIPISTLSAGRNIVTLAIKGDGGKVDSDEVELTIYTTRFLNRDSNYTRDDENGTVTDNVNRIEWEDVNPFYGTLYEGEVYCGGLDRKDQSWRVPDRAEIWYLLQRDENGSSVSDVFQQIDPFGNYLTSEGWSLNLEGGEFEKGISEGYIKCISRESYYDKIDFNSSKKPNTLYDDTHLIYWTDSPKTHWDQMSYEEAVDYCENLELSEIEDWRLPNLQELFSLTENGYREFTNLRFDGPYWSSTKSYGENSVSIAYGVDFRTLVDVKLNISKQIANVICVGRE
jgi:hypothetical protein